MKEEKNILDADELMKNFDSAHVLSQPKRLGIMITLVSNERTTFGELQKILDITPGNLDSHLKKLGSAKYVKIKKAFVGKTPRTIVTITDEGYYSTMLYISKLKRIFETVTDRRRLR